MVNQADAPETGAPLVIAYDGSELAGLAITEAGRQLAAGRVALVVCVWQPADVGFHPVSGTHFDADDAVAVRRAAEETAAYGAGLATAAGFVAIPLAVEAAPTWKGIIETAHDHNANLIVVGSHRHSGLVGHLVGSVSAAITAHSTCTVLLVHERHETSAPA
jgi:nucleotide-binding universal stress UspA family protein